MHRNSIGTNTERHWHTPKNRKRSSAWCPRCQLLSVFRYTSNICETIHAAVVAKEGKCISENIDGLVYEDKCPIDAANIHRTQQFVLVLANYKRARNAQNVTKKVIYWWPKLEERMRRMTAGRCADGNESWCEAQHEQENGWPIFLHSFWQRVFLLSCIFKSTCRFTNDDF